MVWCRQATLPDPIQCRPRSMTSHAVTSPQWVNIQNHSDGNNGDHMLGPTMAKNPPLHSYSMAFSQVYKEKIIGLHANLTKPSWPNRNRPDHIIGQRRLPDREVPYSRRGINGRRTGSGTPIDRWLLGSQQARTRDSGLAAARNQMSHMTTGQANHFTDNSYIIINNFILLPAEF